MRSFAALSVFVALVVVLMLLLGGCGGGGEDAVVRLVGTVVDAGTLAPISDARVVAPSGAETSTGVDGTFDFAEAPADGIVTVTAAGYQNRSLSVNGSGTEVDLGTIELVPATVAGTGTVSGIITAAGVPAVRATVAAGGRTATTRTDGTYLLYNVPAGFQTVYATSSDNTVSGSLNVTVIAGLQSTANIQLGTQPPPPPL